MAEEFSLAQGKLKVLKVALQKRDLEIFQFLLEMRFSDLEVLKKHFFKGDSEHLETCRRRLLKLERSGYVRREDAFLGVQKSYFLATPKALSELERQFPDRVFAKPLRSISASNFHHDLYVLKCRLRLEELGRARDWRSERLLKAELTNEGILIEKEFLPDGIYQNKQGDPVAFEFELSQKTSERYQKKIHHYLSIMEDPEGLFKVCLFVVAKKSVFQILKNLTSPYGTKFRVQALTDLFEGGQSVF